MLEYITVVYSWKPRQSFTNSWSIFLIVKKSPNPSWFNSEIYLKFSNFFLSPSQLRTFGPSFFPRRFISLLPSLCSLCTALSPNPNLVFMLLSKLSKFILKFHKEPFQFFIAHRTKRETLGYENHWLVERTYFIALLCVKLCASRWLLTTKRVHHYICP